MTEENHAISNAKGWLREIIEKTTVLALVKSAGDYDTIEACRDDITESVLSVRVRGGWYAPGDETGFDAKAEEYSILLSTGGPALRIVGELDGSGSIHGEIEPRLQWQDWGTPWTDYPLTESEELAVSQFVACFYFGE